MSSKTTLLSGLLIIFLGVSTYLHDLKNQEKIGHWEYKSSQENSRYPAALPLQIETSIYEDFFTPNNFKNYISYDMKTRFTTDRDEEYYHKKSKSALHTAFSKTFQKLNTEKGADLALVTLLKENLVKEIINSFVLTLGVFKIFDGNFQFDIILTPKSNKVVDYSAELSTNQLVNFNGKETLTNALKKEEISIPEVIANNPVPNSGEIYQYIGGVISISLELADLTPRLRLPDPKKNIVKGNVRLRRYFRINDRSLLNLDLNREGLKTSMIHFEKVKSKTQHFVTVDVDKKLNLETLTPQKKSMTIHFGTIKDLKIKKKSIWTRFRNFVSKKDIDTSKFRLYGNYRANPFKTTIETLKYDFKKKSFDEKSLLYTQQTGSFYDPHEVRQLKEDIKRDLLTTFSKDIISQLKLDQFHSALKGAK